MNILRDLTLNIKKQIGSDEIFLIVGARQSGKTFVLKQIEEALKNKGDLVYFLNLEDPEYLALLNKSPKNLFQIFAFDLKQKSYLLIDEVQYLKNPTNFLKYFFDEYRGRIKIIATGSSAFYLDRKFKDSLAGRKKIFYLSTLSFKEFLRFKAEDDLAKKDFNNLALSDKEKINFYFREFMVYGGYPKVVLSPVQEKEEVLRDLAYSYVKKDIFEANIKEEEVFFRLLRVLASQVGNLLNTSELASTLSVSRSRIDDYLYAMQKSFHIRLVQPFYRNLRKEITKMPKVYFLDIGLRNFLLKNLKLFAERDDKGQVLENVFFRELLEKYDFSDIKFWRTVQKQEVDFIVNEALGFEVKTQLTAFKKSKYSAFVSAYPKIRFYLVSFESEQKEINGVPVLSPWQV